MSALSLGFSPSPNDTHIFHALVHGQIPDAPRFEPVVRDIEALNHLALRGELDVVKVSFHAFGHVRNQYGLLHSGGAMGWACGPLLVAREWVDPEELGRGQIAIPGRLTSAALMAQLSDARIRNLRVLPYHQIMPAVRSGAVAAGVIIHESRFTFPDYGLHRIVDLGEWWEQTTGCPIPLAVIAVRRDLDPELLDQVEQAVSRSVQRAREHRSISREYVRRHAKEMSEEVIEAQIDLYVNDYTADYGSAGQASIREMMGRAEAGGLAVPCDMPLFANGKSRS